MAARILIVDGAPLAAQDRLVDHGGARLSDNYRTALQSQLPPGADIDCVVLAAGDGAGLPPDLTISDFDGIAWTGSPLSAYDEQPIVASQIAFARAAFQAGIPCFGSCWGLQVMAAALGGRVRLHPKGPEVGIARGIVLTEAGRRHAMFDGKPATFDALCVHQDEVCELPRGACVLAGNAFTTIQAVEIADAGKSFWGVQYHPEYDLAQIAALFSRGADRLVAAGFASSLADAKGLATDLMALHHDHRRKDLAWRYGIGADILDPHRHRRELANWLRAKVLTRRAASP